MQLRRLRCVDEWAQMTVTVLYFFSLFLSRGHLYGGFDVSICLSIGLHLQISNLNKPHSLQRTLLYLDEL
jgi:hypothetical protein